MLEGGGSDRIPAWEWFLQQAGYGDIVIVCASCGNIYNQYVLNIHDVDSVQTLKLTKPEAASDPFVIQSIAGADGIFFAGGDQSDYVRVWKDSPVEDAVNAVIARSGAVGGISAGLAILGQFLFAAEKDTIQSGQAMADCYAKKITLERDMLDLPVLTSGDHRHALHATCAHGPDADVHGPRHHRRVGVSRQGDRRGRGRRGARDT